MLFSLGSHRERYNEVAVYFRWKETLSILYFSVIS